jgi:hypothetical protein
MPHQYKSCIIDQRLDGETRHDNLAPFKWLKIQPVIMAAIKSVAEKMGIKEDSRTRFVHPPHDALAAIALPDLSVASRTSGEFDYIHLFVKSQQDLNRQFNILKKHLRATGMLWVSWPKGGKLDTDLNIKQVIKIGYSHGLIESKALSVNETWSALKFTHPKPGKVYKNRYGTLNTTYPKRVKQRQAS